MYFFILGRNPALSIAEILAVLARERVDYKISNYSHEVLLIEIKEDLSRTFDADGSLEVRDLSQIFHELGGSIKFGKIINSKPRVEEFIKFLSPNDQKSYFGFSFYKLDDRVEEADLRQKQRELQKLAMEIKKTLRASGHGARFVTSRERALSSVVVKINKLLNQGTEFVFFIQSSPRFHGPNHGTAQFHSSNHEIVKRVDIIVGKTLAVQEFEEYQLRDYGRPRRDILRGMLPPKIAKMMINLAQAPREATVLDPFCGEGTILTEAAILGYKNLIGTDVDPQAVDDANSNLAWTARQYNVNTQAKFFVADVRNLQTLLQSHGPDRRTVGAVVTEPSLGPLLRGGESLETIQKIKIELEELYKKAFLNFSKILKPGSRVVFIFPIWRTPRGLIFIDLEKVLPKEFKIQNLRNRSLRGHSDAVMPAADHEQGDNLYKYYSSRGGIIWQRPDQRVLREIMVLKFEI